MSVLSNSIRAAISSMALVAVLSPPSALASSGLVLKLLDGSVPIDQPDLFANAYSKAWGNGSSFCPALRSLLYSATTPSRTWTITSCSAPGYGSTDVANHGKLGADVIFSTTITVQGTDQFYKETHQGSVPDTCAFTDRFNLSAQDEFSLSEAVFPPKGPSVSFAPPTFKGTLSSETWDPPCSNEQDEHPGGISGTVALLIPDVASSVNFPGSALFDALSPYQATIEKDLASMIYSLSVATGDLDIQVINSVLREEVDHARPMSQTLAPGSGTVSSSQGNSVAASAWGAQPAQATSGASNTTPNWAPPASAPTPPRAGSVINRSVGSSLQPVQPQPGYAAPASLGGSH